MSELALSSLKRDIARVGANENTGWRAQIHDGIVVKVETFLETFQSVAAYLEEEVDGPELIKTTYAQCEEIAADCAELDNKYVDVIGGLTSLKHHMQTWQAKDKQERKEVRCSRLTPRFFSPALMLALLLLCFRASHNTRSYWTSSSMRQQPTASALSVIPKSTSITSN
jgi:hypothetical protein